MAEIGNAPEGFPRLMQAARALAGLSIDDLAAKLTDEEGLSARSLRDIESGKREHVAPSKRKAIIAACDLPEAFLTGDIWWLQDLEDAMDRLPEKVLSERVPHELIRDAFAALSSHTQARVDSDQTRQLVERLTDERANTLHEEFSRLIERVQGQLDDLSRELAERALEDAEQKRQGVERVAPEAPDRDASKEGAEA
jgi:transcriptional regulator with XRE-family HTH domain